MLYFASQLSEEKKNLATSLESLQADAEFTTSQFEKAKGENRVAHFTREGGGILVGCTM